MTAAPHQLAKLLGQLEPARLAAVISLLPVDALLAVGVGAQVALNRADHEFAELLAADYAEGRWHRTHPLPEITELHRHRWPPNSDRAEWIAYGPAGRPQPTKQEAA